MIDDEGTNSLFLFGQVPEEVLQQENHGPVKNFIPVCGCSYLEHPGYLLPPPVRHPDIFIIFTLLMLKLPFEG